MELARTFHVPVRPDRVFAILTDLGRLGPCLPGVHVEASTGDTAKARFKVEGAPIAVTYHGTARVSEADRKAGTIHLSAEGKEIRGGGEADADIRISLMKADGGTDVALDAKVGLTGSASELAPEVLSSLGERILDTFTERVGQLAAEASGLPSPSEAIGRVADVLSTDDGRLDTEAVGTAAKKALPFAGAVAAIAAIVWRVRKR